MKKQLKMFKRRYGKNCFQCCYDDLNKTRKKTLIESPNFALRLGVHWRADGTLKFFGKFVEIAKRANDTETTWRMNCSLHFILVGFATNFAAPDLTEVKKEKLRHGQIKVGENFILQNLLVILRV